MMASIILNGVLGEGGEGTVYLARDLSTNNKLIVKYFFEPICGNPSRALRHYATTIKENKYGLPKISLLEVDDQIVGLKYDFTRLHDIHWRIFERSDLLAKVMFGNYCRMQYYLISHANLALADPALINFMMAQNGVFHYIDFGYGVKQIDHPHVWDYGRLGYGFVMLLGDIYHKNIKDEILPYQGYSLEHPCIYCGCDFLDEIGEGHPWIKDLVSEVRGYTASVFQNADFYKNLADRFPSRILFPSRFILTSYCLFSIAKFKSMLSPSKKE